MKGFSTNVSLLLLFLLVHVETSAQHTKEGTNHQFLLFPDFSTATVLMKTGKTEPGLLNYDIDGQQVVFVQNNQQLVLTALETIDTIYLQQRKFVPVATRVAEVLNSDRAWTLLATYHVKRQHLTATTDQGGTARKPTNEVNNTVTDVYVGRNFRDNVNILVQPRFYLQHKGATYRVGSKMQLMKMLNEEQRAWVNGYLRTHRVSFAQPQEMIELLHALAQLK